MNKSFYFFLRPQGTPEAAGYQHCMVALGEGMRSLGIPFYANIHYWKDSGTWLFQHKPEVSPDDCDIIITSDEYIGADGSVPSRLFDGRKYMVFVDSSDGWRTRTETAFYRRYNLVLRTHYNRHYRYPDNVKPWSFGLTERIISACGCIDNNSVYTERSPRALVNFRVGHPVRQRAENSVLPTLSKRFEIDRSTDRPPASGSDRELWEATGRRHYPSFYERLSTSQASAAFGGYFAPGLLSSTEFLAERALYALFWRLERKTRTVMQFDSWRFWESLCAGCLTLHVDLQAYGCALPVMPQSGIQYLGFDFDSTDSIALLRDSSDESLGNIAAAGRTWVLEQYSPKATVLRLLQMMDV